MKEVLSSGDLKTHRFVVQSEHFPDLGGKVVHPVCSTYVLAREIEWSSRKFMLEVIDADEEGIGTMLEISHQSPAFEGEEVEIKAVLISFEERVMICEFEAKVENRLVARGRTGQKLLKKQQLQQLYNKENK